MLEELIKQEFPQDDDLIYLNHAAVAPWPARTAKAVQAFAKENTYSGASHYKRWLGKEIELRQQLQRLINAPSSNDIALLKNTSEGLSVVACGLNWRKGDNVVTSDEEFPSNRIPWIAQQKHGVTLNEVSLNATNPEEALMAACDKRTRVLAISSVQYASGLRLDLSLLGQFCRSNNILFCVDAIQSLGAHPFDCQEIKADFVMADGHKWMLGPEGIALFYCREELREQLRLHQYGWHMIKQAGNYDSRDCEPASSAKRFECGSPNMLGIYALSASLSLLDEIGMNRISRIIISNISYLIDKLGKTKDINFISNTQREQQSGILTFELVNKDSAKLHTYLMENNVICANRGGGIRFSPHFYISQKKLDKALDILARFQA